MNRKGYKYCARKESITPIHDLFQMQAPIIEGFDTLIVKSTADQLLFRTNIFNKEDFFSWKEKFSETTNTTFNIKRTSHETAKYKFCQMLVCQHGGRFRNSQSKHRKVDTK